MKATAQEIVSALFGPIIPQWMRRKRRQMQRAAKREEKHAAFHVAGLNGKQAVARRQRQIERGQLRVSA
jgi:hypothetical protein